MPLAGHLVVFEASLDDAAYTEIDGIKEASFSPTRDLADVTYFKTADAARRKFALLKDGTINLSGHYEVDANGQGRVRAKFDDGAVLYLRIKFNPGGGAGLEGYKVACKVENWEAGSSVDDVVTWSATAQFDGLPVAV
jgi:hypothetical protein